MPLSKKAETRIKRLIDIMEKLLPRATKHFNMYSFIDHNTEDDHEHPLPRSTEEVLHSCGTTLCAAGWTATDPYFRRAGLKFDDSNGMIGIEEVFDLTSVVTPMGREHDINEDFNPFDALFGGNLPFRTPKQWAKYARALLTYWKKPVVGEGPDPHAFA